MKRKPTSKKMSNTRSTHHLVGTWTQEENPFFVTSVVYTVAFKDGRFVVSGVDEIDGVALEISNVRWDGECLRFVSLFAPTNDKAKHALRLIGKDKISHSVIHSSEEGPCTDDERWVRRPQRRKRSER
jgi:hypothetical protein